MEGRREAHGHSLWCARGAGSKLCGSFWAYRKLREVGERRPVHLDWWGSLTFGAGLTALLAGITYGLLPLRPVLDRPGGGCLALEAAVEVQAVADGLAWVRVAGRRWQWVGRGRRVRRSSPRRISCDLIVVAGRSRASRGLAGSAEHQLSGALRLGECQQRGRDVGVGQLVVRAAERDGELPLGGERGASSSGRAWRPGGMHGQQVPGGPGGDPCRPADESLALRAAAEHDHHPLPGMTVTRTWPPGRHRRRSLTSLPASHSRASSRSADRFGIWNQLPGAAPARSSG